MKLYKDGTIEGTPKEIAEYLQIPTTRIRSDITIAPADAEQTFVKHPLDGGIALLNQTELDRLAFQPSSVLMDALMKRKHIKHVTVGEGGGEYTLNYRLRNGCLVDTLKGEGNHRILIYKE